MKVKPLQSLMKSKEEARKVVEQTAQWHKPSPNLPDTRSHQHNGFTIQINIQPTIQQTTQLPPIVIRTESQQLPTHQAVLTERNTQQFPARELSFNNLLTNIPVPVPPAPQISLSHLVNQLQETTPEVHSNMDVVELPAAKIEGEATS